MMHRFGEKLSGGRIPNAGGAGFGAGGDGATIGAEAGPNDCGFVSKGRERGFSGGRIPELGCAVGGGGQEPPVIGAKRGDPADATVMQRTQDELSVRDRPDTDG